MLALLFFSVLYGTYRGLFFDQKDGKKWGSIRMKIGSNLSSDWCALGGCIRHYLDEAGIFLILDSRIFRQLNKITIKSLEFKLSVKISSGMSLVSLILVQFRLTSLICFWSSLFSDLSLKSGFCVLLWKNFVKYK